MDEQHLHRQELLQKLEQNRRYQLKESLWKERISPTTVEKLKLMKQKSSLKVLEREEKDFLSGLKMNLGERFNRLQKSYEQSF